MNRYALARGVAVRWNAFWHQETSHLALGLFRILFAYCLFREVSTTQSRSIFAIAGGGFHLPYVDFIQPMPEWAYESVHAVQYVFIVLLGLGIYSRLSCGVLLLLQGWVFFADQLNFRNHPYFFLLVLVILLFSPASEALALRPLLRARQQRRSLWKAFVGPRGPITWQRLIQVQVCLVYLFAGFQKLRPAYLDGLVLQRILSRDLPTRGSGDFLARFLSTEDMAALLQTLWLFQALALATVLMELTLPLALWFRKTRGLAILAGTGFHLTIAFVMEIHVFSYAMLGTYLLFLEPKTFSEFFERLRNRIGSRERGMMPAPSAQAS